MVLAAGTVVRIVAGPMLGRLADQLGSRRVVLAIAAALAGIIGSGYLVAWGFVPLLLVCMAHSAAEATLAPLSDALAVSASTSRRGFQYGWVRGTGSAAFVGGTLLSGQLVDRYGLFVIVVASSALFIVMAGCATRVQEPQPASGASSRGPRRRDLPGTARHPGLPAAVDRSVPGDRQPRLQRRLCGAHLACGRRRRHGRSACSGRNRSWPRSWSSSCSAPG